MIDALWKHYRRKPTPKRRNALAERYLHLAERTARLRAKNLPRYEPADLLASATLGLLRAIERYDPAKGVRFETFAWYYIHGAISDQLRRDDKLPDTLRRRIKSGAAPELLHFSLTPDIPDGRRPSNEAELLEGLPPLATIVFYSRYWLGHTFRDIAKYLALTESAARDIHDQAITSIRKREAAAC